MSVHSALFVANGELVDMSFPYENNMATWPGLLAYNITLAHKGPFLKAPYVTFFNIELSEQTGTHMDAPSHFGKGRPTVDEIPLQSLIGEAIVINITEQASKDPDYELTVDDLTNWEEKHGRIPDGSILFLLTGFGEYWGDANKYFGIKEEKINATSENFHWPGFHNRTAQWLVEYRKIMGIGTDARSYDKGQSKTLPAHQIFLANNIYGLESVANIDKLPVKGATVYVMPMKIKGGSGGPTRIIAQTDPTGGSFRQTTTIGPVLISALLSTMMFTNGQ